jgi:hypothetical protein
MSHTPSDFLDSAPARHLQCVLTIGLAFALFLPTVALVGVHRVEERFLFAEAGVSTLPSPDVWRGPGRAWVHVEAVGTDCFVVEYRIMGVAWMMRLLAREVPRRGVQLGFRSSLDLVFSIPSFLLLALGSWWLAGLWLRRRSPFQQDAWASPSGPASGSRHPSLAIPLPGLRSPGRHQVGVYTRITEVTDAAPPRG